MPERLPHAAAPRLVAMELGTLNQLRDGVHQPAPGAALLIGGTLGFGHVAGWYSLRNAAGRNLCGAPPRGQWTNKPEICVGAAGSAVSQRRGHVRAALWPIAFACATPVLLTGIASQRRPVPLLEEGPDECRLLLRSDCSMSIPISACGSTLPCANRRSAS
jgi:hypothetical protein